MLMSNLKTNLIQRSFYIPKVVSHTKPNPKVISHTKPNPKVVLHTKGRFTYQTPKIPLMLELASYRD